ncbi:MAG: response regulator transcription factor [Planctomycetales bacterium]|nr:response regulator transcription factor [Planctomycetales bacterium]
MMSSPRPPYRVLIVEDHPLVRLGLATSLSLDDDMTVCGEAETESDAWRSVRATRPDAAIVDINLRDGSGLDLIRRLRTAYPRMGIVVSSMHSRDSYEARSLLAGADAYVPKSQGAELLLACVREAIASRKEAHEAQAAALPSSDSQSTLTLATHIQTPTIQDLSDRELEVFRLIGEGLTTRAIAERLHRSVKTIETHKARLKTKLGLSTSAELARDAARWRLNA